MCRSKSLLPAVIVAILAMPSVSMANTPPPCPAEWEPPDTSVSCEPAVTTKEDVSKDPLQKGQPLHGSGIRKMTPEEAETMMRERGYCFTFRYDGGRWCSAPPSGQVEDLAYLPDGEMVVFVHDDEPHAYEDVPPQGRDCPVG